MLRGRKGERERERERDQKRKREEGELSLQQQTTWTGPCTFLGKAFQKWFGIASFLGLRESDWSKVTQLDLCLSRNSLLSLKMLNSQWRSLGAIMGVLLIHSVARVHSLCWDNSWCWDMETEVKMLECLRACRMGVSNESPVYPGNGHMQPLSENIQKYIHWNKFGKSNSNGSNFGNKRKDLSSDSSADLFSASSENQDSWEGESHQESQEKQEGKRSYAMEHFRWGKPVGRKRRPIKVNPNGVEEESSESYPQEFRRDLSWEMEYPEFDSPEEKQSSEATKVDKEKQLRKIKNVNAAYKMHHFRWNTPALSKKKRYGGFMTSEHSHTPLVTLFKNAIIKTAYKKGQ